MNLDNPRAVAAVIQAGRQAAMSVAVDPARDDAGRVYLRTIANELERHMHSHFDSSIHWVSVIGEDSPFGRPTAVWTYDDCLLQVGLVQGNSEGMLLYVHAQADRYAPAKLTPLLRIKVLCGPERATQEVQIVWKWLHSLQFRVLTEPQPTPVVEPAASTCSCSARGSDAIGCAHQAAS